MPNKPEKRIDVWARANEYCRKMDADSTKDGNLVAAILVLAEVLQEGLSKKDE